MAMSRYAHDLSTWLSITFSWCISFGMVITEMCTRDIPFAELMLEKKEIIDLICGKKDESILKVLI